jgi:hypothetical protein
VSTRSTDSVKKTSANNLNRQIGLYSLAATVAGVSMLALAEPSAAEVVVTKKTIPIPLTADTRQKPVKISMANNGIDNFSFILDNGSDSAGPRQLLIDAVSPGQSGAQNEFLVGGDFYSKALALSRGVTIGPSPSFSFSGALIEGTNSSQGGYYSRGYWGGNPTNKYLGVRFQLKGQTHYGWIRLTVTVDTKSKKPSLEATITGYAYESVANKPIKAGAAAMATVDARVSDVTNRPSLGMLAAGAEGMTLWRREGSSVRL